MKRKIIVDESKLIDRSDEVDINKDKETVQEVVENLKTLIEKNNYIALSAKQIGNQFRIFCVNFNGDIKTFINPMITKRNGLHLSRETNPSLPDREFVVPRNDEIIMMYQNQQGIIEHNSFSGLASEIIQQQDNLLDGILLSEFGLEIDEEFNKASEEEQSEVLDYYMSTLENRDKTLQDTIKSDDKLKVLDDYRRYMEALGRGDIEIEKPEIHLNREQRRAADREAKRLDALLRRKMYEKR